VSPHRPDAFRELGMSDVGMLIDGKDILIEGSRVDSALKRLCYSNKMKHAALRGLPVMTDGIRIQLFKVRSFSLQFVFFTVRSKTL
jgi:hypothetical protein